MDRILTEMLESQIFILIVVVYNTTILIIIIDNLLLQSTLNRFKLYVIKRESLKIKVHHRQNTHDQF